MCGAGDSPRPLSGLCTGVQAERLGCTCEGNRVTAARVPAGWPLFLVQAVLLHRLQALQVVKLLLQVVNVLVDLLHTAAVSCNLVLVDLRQWELNGVRGNHHSPAAVQKGPHESWESLGSQVDPATFLSTPPRQDYALSRLHHAATHHCRGILTSSITTACQLLALVIMSSSLLSIFRRWMSWEALTALTMVSLSTNSWGVRQNRRGAA